MKLKRPFYDPTQTYENNYTNGPFGAFAQESKFIREGEPQESFLENKIYLPFGIPAGPLINSKFVEAALRQGFDICVYKTVRTREHPCHPWPNVLAVDIEENLTMEMSHNQKLVATDKYDPSHLAITNSFGVPSAAPEIWQEDMAQAVRATGIGQVVVGSFQGTHGEGTTSFKNDHVLAARLVKETGAKILEMNLSCPNEGTSNLLCFDTRTTLQIVEAVKNEIGNTPLVLKLAYFEDDNALREFARQVGSLIEGLAAINTIPATIVDENGNQALYGESRSRSGVCGAPIRWAGLDMVRRLKGLREEFALNFVIVGVGGVTVPNDYQEYRSAGADAVMAATAAMWNPHLAREIWGGTDVEDLLLPQTSILFD